MSRGLSAPLILADIVLGQRAHCGLCPAARALNRAFPHHTALVFSTHVELYRPGNDTNLGYPDRRLHMLPGLRSAITIYDNEFEMQPGILTLDLAAGTIDLA